MPSDRPICSAPASASAVRQSASLSDLGRGERFCFVRTMRAPATIETIATASNPSSRMERGTVPPEGGPPFPFPGDPFGGPLPFPGKPFGGPLPFPGKPFGGPLPFPGSADTPGANSTSAAANAVTQVHRLDALPWRSDVFTPPTLMMQSIQGNPRVCGSSGCRSISKKVASAAI